MLTVSCTSLYSIQLSEAVLHSAFGWFIFEQVYFFTPWANDDCSADPRYSVSSSHKYVIIFLCWQFLQIRWLTSRKLEVALLVLCRFTKKGKQAGCNDGFQFAGNFSPGKPNRTDGKVQQSKNSSTYLDHRNETLIFENTLRDRCNSAEHVVKPNHVQIWATAGVELEMFRPWVSLETIIRFKVGEKKQAPSCTCKTGWTLPGTQP